MFHTEEVWSGYLSTSGHLTNHSTNIMLGWVWLFFFFRHAAPGSDTDFKQLHDGGVLWVIGVQARLRGPFTNFFHIIQSRSANVGHSIQVAKNTKRSSSDSKYNKKKYSIDVTAALYSVRALISSKLETIWVIRQVAFLTDLDWQIHLLVK